jgi:hypothetical protein
LNFGNLAFNPFLLFRRYIREQMDDDVARFRENPDAEDEPEEEEQVCTQIKFTVNIAIFQPLFALVLKIKVCQHANCAMKKGVIGVVFVLAISRVLSSLFCRFKL